MYLHWIIFALVLMTDLYSVRAVQNCSAAQYAKAKKDLFVHLGLDKNDYQNPRMWHLIFNHNPANNAKVNPDDIYVDIYVSSITNVNEKAQSLTTQVKIITAWRNSNMTWNAAHFCGIHTFAAPKMTFWSPDIAIKESIQTEFGTKKSLNVQLRDWGFLLTSEVLSLTTACKMDLYRFPFDTQICNITFQCSAYSKTNLVIRPLTDANEATFASRESFEAQGERELLSTNISNSQATIFLDDMDQIIYQITIKRNPVLYVINIIVPVFVFFVLDVMFFFVGTNGADKVTYKVTLLLSFSVLLLIFNDTLPSTSRRIPLIGVYCSGIFCLIGISILETILVNYLMTKGVKKRSAVETTAVTDCVRDQQKLRDSVRDQNEEKYCTLDLLKQILRAATNRNQRRKTSLSWTAWARIIDVTFLVLYIITIIVFVSVLINRWFP